jgi:hypothetical protein
MTNFVQSVWRGRDGNYYQKLFALPVKHERLTLQLTSLHAFREASRDRGAPADKLVSFFDFIIIYLYVSSVFVSILFFVHLMIICDEKYDHIKT